MAEVKTMRLNKVLREFNISLDRAVEYLSSKGYEVESRPTTKISSEEYQILLEEFQTRKFVMYLIIYLIQQVEVVVVDTMAPRSTYRLLAL